MMHPRLFQALAFLEPMIQLENPTGSSGPMVARSASKKPDLWSSRQAAEVALRKGTFLRSWSKGAVDNYLRYGLRDTPTAVYPLSSHVPKGSVTLTTSKAQEAWTFLRMAGSLEKKNRPILTDQYISHDVTNNAGDDHLNNANWLMNCAAPCMAFELLPHIRPPVLYIFGSRSHINNADRQNDKIQRTGTGLGGSGGAASGRVRAQTVIGASHMMPMERHLATAELLGQLLEEQNNEYKAEKRFHSTHESGKSVQNETMLSPQWMEMMDKPAGVKISIKSNL
jgi:pimeloyl-ACP methyl ester carboxylesterase